MKYLLLIIGALAILTGCDKIIAKDITGKTPVLILPTAGAQIDSDPVHFKWEEMDGASKYHLMIVSPSFASPQTYILDSLVTDTEFFMSLDSNAYELKLVGVNGGYRSDTLGPIAFEVISGGGGSSTDLELTSPLEGEYLNASFGGNFTWNSLSDVLNYEFTLRQGTDFATATQVETQTGITTSNTTYSTPLEEGEYIWRVTANFNSGATTYTTQTFAIDTTAPNQAALLLPLDNSSQSTGFVTFTWSNGVDQGVVQSPVISHLEVATEAAFVNSNVYEVNGNLDSLDFQTAGTYYWRVQNIDEAENQTNYSAVRSFIVQ